MSKFNKKLTISVSEEPQSSHEQFISFHKPHITEKESLLQFRDYRDGGDSEGGQTRQDHPSNKINYVEFQEFNVNKFELRETLKTEGDDKKTPKHKRNFTIQVPDRDGQKFNEKNNQMVEANFQASSSPKPFKQPPAPSKGSKYNKVFVFPNSPKRQQQKDTQGDQIIEELKKSFERERQQFYKQKSRLEKEILIKNGQIDMLQKIVKEKYSSDDQKEKRYIHSYAKDEGLKRMENILLEKDLQISQLLEKIAYLGDSLTNKNEQLNKKLMENVNLESLVESLRNQLYIYEKKSTNQNLNKKFYYLQKQRDRQRSWEEEQDIDISLGLMDYGRKGIEQLNKRIQVIRHNRKEINSRQKINSDFVSYSQSTKNRAKGAFDFKGKAFEGERLNKTRIF